MEDMYDLMLPLERLESMGFKRVGEWRIEVQELTLKLNEHADEQNILYAFVVDGEVVYIGKTVQPLKRRLYGYQRPGPTQSTNNKGNEFIKEKLSSKKLVEIYALPDNGLLSYG